LAGTFPFFDRPLVLASASPRRRFLLDLVGFDFEVVEPRVNEEEHAHEDPVKHVLRLSEMKARSVAGRLDQGLVLGADTVVLLGNEILEKPRSEEEAFDMLSRLSGAWHVVYTGLTVVDAATGRAVAGHETTRVKIREMTPGEIRAYIKTGEPMDKAGSYGIQGYGAAIVESVEGCYFNVVGLPLVRLLRLLKQFAGDPGGVTHGSRDA
jgi:septum formation protein